MLFAETENGGWYCFLIGFILFAFAVKGINQAAANNPQVGKAAADGLAGWILRRFTK